MDCIGNVFGSFVAFSMYRILLYSIHNSEKSEGDYLGYSYNNPCLNSNSNDPIQPHKDYPLRSQS